MKICIIGPVTTSTHTGGVATFVEGIAGGFAEIGHDVTILTNRADKLPEDSNKRIISLGSKSKLYFILKSQKYLREQSYDLIIGSTWYDLALSLEPKIGGIKIHYLHGFGVPRDGVIKAIGISINDRLRKKNCLLIANSGFTKLINETFFRNRVDAVIPIGLSPIFKTIASEQKSSLPRKYDVIYVGRVRYNKGVDKIIEAIQYVKKKYGVELACAIIGDGPQLNFCKEKSERYRLNIDFIGKIGQEKAVEYYQQGKVFISLDPKEPYGQTFIEALICGCRVICPTSGGQLEYLSAYEGCYKMVKCSSISSIGETIYSECMKSSIDIDTNGIYTEHSYERAARQIIDFIGKKLQN